MKEGFTRVIEFLCVACSPNDYHSNISQLITRAITFRDNSFHILSLYFCDFRARVDICYRNCEIVV